MKINLYPSFVFLLSLIFMLSACRKDIDIEIISDPMPIDLPGDIIQTGVAGYISTVDGVPIGDAEVNVGNSFVLTDENGTFNIQEVELLSTGSVITVTKDGFYINAKNIQVHEQANANVKMKLSSRVKSASFPSDQGIDYLGPSGERLQVPAGVIVDSEGNSYQGDVDLYVNWVSPISKDLATLLPGDQRGIDAESNFVQLATYGMIAIELEASNGDVLQLSSDGQASIEIPIPSVLVSGAPASITLWHYSKDYGFWIEDGDAALNGNKYVGTISHFNYWNCNIAFSHVNLSGVVFSELGFPYAAVPIHVKSDGKLVGYGYTNEDGSFSVQVPAGENLTLEIVSNCTAGLVSQNITPLSEDKVLDPIIIDEELELRFISGIVTDCNLDPVNDGYVIIDIDGKIETAYLNEEGAFSNLINVCDAERITIKAISNSMEGGIHSELELFTDFPQEIWPQIHLQICDELGNDPNILFFQTDEKQEVFIEDVRIYIDEETAFVVVEHIDSTNSNFFRLEFSLEDLENQPIIEARYFYIDYTIPNSGQVNYECTLCFEMYLFVNVGMDDNIDFNFFSPEGLDSEKGNISSIGGFFAGKIE